MNSLIIARRDLASYLQGYSAYIIIAGLLLGNGVFFHAFALGADQARYSHEILENFFYLCWGFSVATAVLLTMRSLADEHALGTEVLLRTSVLADGEVVIGKWLAAMGMVGLYVGLTLHMPLLIFVNGKVSVAHLLVGYLGVLLGGGAAAALGVLCSALFRNQLGCGHHRRAHRDLHVGHRLDDGRVRRASVQRHRGLHRESSTSTSCRSWRAG